MLTLDTLCLFKAYRINQSRAHSPEQNSRHRFLKQNKSSTLLLYYLTVIIIKSSLLLLLLLVPFVRFQSLCQCYKTSSSTEHICKGKNVWLVEGSHLISTVLPFVLLDLSFFLSHFVLWERLSKAEWEDAERSIIWPLQGWALLSFLNIYNILLFFFWFSILFSYMYFECVCVWDSNLFLPPPQIEWGAPRCCFSTTTKKSDGRRERDIRFIIARTRKGDAVASAKEHHLSIPRILLSRAKREEKRHPRAGKQLVDVPRCIQYT